MRKVFLITFLFWFGISEGDAEEFRIGAILSLTGPAADYGESMKNAFILAESARPNAHRNVRFIEDSKNDAKTAVAAFRKLQHVDKVDLVYVWGVAPCGAVTPIAEAIRQPTIAQCYDVSSSRGRNYVIRFMNSTDQYMKLLARYLQGAGIKRIGVLLSETPFIEEMYEGFERSLAPDQTIELLGRYHTTESDFRISISRMRAANFEAVGAFLSLGQVAQFFRQAKEQRLAVPFFGTLSLESRQEILASNGGMEGTLFAGNDVEARYLERYRERFGSDSQYSFGAMAYEFSDLAADLFGDGQRRSPDEIIRQFETVSFRKGTAVPSYRFEKSTAEGRYFEFPLVMKRIHGDSSIELVANPAE